SRSPSSTITLTSRRARTLIMGLVARWNICRTRNSLRLIRPSRRTRKVRLTLSSSIRAIGIRSLPKLGPPCPASASFTRNGLQVEDEPPLTADQDQGGGGEGKERGQGGHGEDGQGGQVAAHEDRLTDHLEEGAQGVVVQQPTEA